MASDKPGSDAGSGQREATLAGNNANTSARRSQEELRKADPAALRMSKPPLSSTARISSPSPVTSPRTSRTTSPTRHTSKTQPLTGAVATQPSAAAIQRALSAANAPQLQAVAKPSKVVGALGESASQRPTSPTVKSPPPSETNGRRTMSAAPTRTESATTPSISVQNAPAQTSTPPPTKQESEQTAKVSQLSTPVKAASRGASGKSTLETVQENSTDDVKDGIAATGPAATDSKPSVPPSEDESLASKHESSVAGSENTTQPPESGSESAGTKSPKKTPTSAATQRPRNAQNKSYASLASTKSRQGDVKQGMTVETETVPSIPQSALNLGDRLGGGRGENSGSIKQKPSSETIRPKKERKKVSQKARSINQSTTSSKADIFEQRVANAVDEANSSESDETFVYESNPIEPRRAQHHSRTPSVTSSNSVNEQQRSGIRNIGDIMDDRRVAGKRSMKFSNNANNDIDSPDGKSGSVRSHTPRHYGRFGRGGGQQSMFDPDSPFTQASKLRSNYSRSSGPNSPKMSHNLHQQQQRSSGLFSRKQEPSYDFEAEVGDDERTPLVGTVRTSRGSRMNRQNTRSPSIDDYYGVRRHGRCGRVGGCCLALMVLVVVLCSASAFLVMSNQPLYDVRILQVENVLASEQELMLDLWVSAVNPNALTITITDMDLNIFAKSKHIGSGGNVPFSAPRWQSKRKWRKDLSTAQGPPTDEQGIWLDLSHHWHAPNDGVDEGTDPPDDDLERDAQTMLLGQILHFDQALTFAGSPLKRDMHNSTGELRLEKPGNKTEVGGSERWERVLQSPFELIIRGFLKYQLPISNRPQTVAVKANVTVDPDEVDSLGWAQLEMLHIH